MFCDYVHYILNYTKDIGNMQ